MVETIKTDVDRPLLVSKLKRSSIFKKSIRNFLLLSKPRLVYLDPLISSLPFFKFSKQNVMYFGVKHVETRPNFLHELATFLKYHMSY